MNLARFSVSRPVAAGIINFALLLIGLFYVTRMPVSLYPDISFPFISVSIGYPGASPEQIEAKLLKPIESEIAGVKGVSRIMGKAVQNGGLMVVGFRMSVDDQEALDAVREKVSAVRSRFPTGIKEPVIQRIDFGATPILIFGVASDGTASQTKKQLEDGLIRTLQRIEGVKDATVMGLGERQIELQLDAQNLTSMRIAPLEIFEFLSGHMNVVPWGDLKQDNKQASVARENLSDNLADWEKLEVNLKDGRTANLQNLGSTLLRFDENATQVLVDGKPGLGLVVTKRADANTVDTIARVHARLKDEPLPPGVKLFSIIDQATYIEANAHEVWIALFAGGLFAVLVILFFLTDVKSALISATALPVSVAGSFIFMSAFGFSLNMLTLLALSLAIGLLIDDAVVVRESIFREMENGKSALKAAVDGTDKVASAVLATTLAVVAVFLPVAMMGGMVGQFFKQFGITICIAVLLSMWVAFTLDPMLSAKFGGHPKPIQGRFWDALRSGLSKTDETIAAWARWSFKNPIKIILASVGLLVFAALLSASRGAEFLALEDRDQFLVSVRAPAGSTREQNISFLENASERLRDLPGLQHVFATVGEPNDPLLSTMRLVFVSKNDRKENISDLQKLAKQRLDGFGAPILVMEPPPIEGVGGEAPVTVFIYGDDFNQMRVAANETLNKIQNVKGISTARIETADSALAYDVKLKSSQFVFSGTNAQAVELTGRLALTGLESGNVGDDNTPFVVRLKPSDANLETVLNDILVPTLRGPEPLSKFTELTESHRPTIIERERRSRKIVIWGSLDRTRSYGNVLEDVQTIVDNLPKPIWGEIAGDKEYFEEMIGNFSLALIGSFFFIFIVLAVQFENLFRPFVIILSLPLAIIGGFIGLYVTGNQLAMGAIIGFILLIGLAAKNGILLVDAIGEKEKEIPIFEAVVESVRERSRPILMTSIAMVFGMIPTALLRGAGSEFRSPMAIAIIGGVISSTMLSFLVVPAIFGLVEVIKKRLFKNVRISGIAILISAAISYQQQASAQQKSSVGQRNQIFAELVRDVAANSAEAASIRSAVVGADGSASASLLSFIGGTRVELSREWAKPGITQSVTLPLPPPIGPITNETVILPKVQNTALLAWQFPIFNLQVFESVRLKNHLSAQVPVIKNAQTDVFTASIAQLLLQYCHAKMKAEHKSRVVENALFRKKVVESRSQSGTTRRVDETLAQVEADTARIELLQAQSDMQRLQFEFEQRSQKKFPTEGLELPDLPFSNLEFQSNAVNALAGAYQVQLANADVNNATRFPTVSVEVAHQRTGIFERDAAEPQNLLAVRAQWSFLDGGRRIREFTLQSQVALDILSEKQRVEAKLRSDYLTLPLRYKTLQDQLALLNNTRSQAQLSLKSIQEAYKVGLANGYDLKQAEDSSIKAELALIDVQVAVRALSMESLLLTSRWLSWLSHPSEN